jgi:dTMP kinase
MYAEPDVTIQMDLSVDEAAKRGQYGQERYEKLEFQRAVCEKFKELRGDRWKVRHTKKKKKKKSPAVYCNGMYVC